MIRALFVIPEYLPYGGAVASIVRKTIEFDNSNEIVYDVLTLKMRDSLEDKRINLVDSIYSYGIKKAIHHINNVNDFKAVLGRICKKLFHIKGNGWIDNYTVVSFYNRMSELEIKNHYDVIIPVVASPSMFEAAKLLKDNGYTGKIVVFQVDPIAGNKYHDPNRQMKWLEYERMMYETADKVIVHPVQYQTSPLLNKFSELSTKTKVMEWPMLQKLGPTKSRELSSQEKIICFFSGYLDETIRSPEYCLKLIDRITNPKIKFDFYSPGKEQLILKYTSEHAAQRLAYHEAVSLDECLHLMRQADILINIGNNCTNQMPSKIFDYINTGKPIINICKASECPTLQYMKRYPLALNIFEEANLGDNAMLMEQFILNHVSKSVAYEEIEKIFFECTNAYVANYFNAVIKEI